MGQRTLAAGEWLTKGTLPRKTLGAPADSVPISGTILRFHGVSSRAWRRNQPAGLAGFLCVRLPNFRACSANVESIGRRCSSATAAADSRAGNQGLIGPSTYPAGRQRAFAAASQCACREGHWCGAFISSSDV